MNTETSKPLLRAFAIQAVVTIISVVSGIVTILKQDYLLIAVALALLLVAAEFYAFYEAVLANYHKFKSEEDQKFSEFFTKWYRQDGEHRIFCKDLDWLDNGKVVDVKKALISQGTRVKIFVSDDGAKAVTDIREAGGSVIRVPYEMVRIQMKFSLHSVDTAKNLIIRRKQPGARGVKFSETRDPIIIGLVQTVMAACEHLPPNPRKLLGNTNG